MRPNMAACLIIAFLLSIGGWQVVQVLVILNLLVLIIFLVLYLHFPRALGPLDPEWVRKCNETGEDPFNMRP